MREASACGASASGALARGPPALDAPVCVASPPSPRRAELSASAMAEIALRLKLEDEEDVGSIQTMERRSGARRSHSRKASGGGASGDGERRRRSSRLSMEVWSLVEREDDEGT